MIFIESLRFRYPDSSFSLCMPVFSVSQGEKLAVIGPSGSMKSDAAIAGDGCLALQDGNLVNEVTVFYLRVPEFKDNLLWLDADPNRQRGIVRVLHKIVVTDAPLGDKILCWFMTDNSFGSVREKDRGGIDASEFQDAVFQVNGIRALHE